MLKWAFLSCDFFIFFNVSQTVSQNVSQNVSLYGTTTLSLVTQTIKIFLSCDITAQGKVRPENFQMSIETSSKTAGISISIPKVTIEMGSRPLSASLRSPHPLLNPSQWMALSPKSPLAITLNTMHTE